MMRALAVLLSGALLCTACGEDPPVPATEAAAPDRETLLQGLFEAQDAEALQAAITAARAGGIHEQAILEARFVSLVDAGDNAAIGALGKELEAAVPSFKIEHSAIFSVKEEFLAIVEYSHALAALENGDRDSFKKHIKEAFWLSPNQASAFTPHIERLRLQEAMAKLRIDFQRTLNLQESGKAITLAEASKASTYTLLHFWSPWSEECAAFLEDFQATARELSKNGVAVLSILAETTPEALPPAAEFVAAAKESTQCTWLLDNPEQPLARELRLANVPTVALIHKDGRVLFNGHPAENELWNQLKQAVPAITRPAVETDSLPDETPNN